MKQIFDNYGEAIVAFLASGLVVGIIIAVLIEGGYLSTLIATLGNGAV